VPIADKTTNALPQNIEGSGQTLGIQCSCLTADAAGQVTSSTVIMPSAFVSIAATFSFPITNDDVVSRRTGVGE
jgi:hypothetical protein